MDRITHQSPRQRGYGSTSSLWNDSTRGSTREEGRNRTKKQSSQALADRPARRGGPSALASRTVRPATADRLRQPYGPSGPLRGPSIKSHRTNCSDPRTTDRPRGAHGLSARHPRTVRPLLRTVRNSVQPKTKISTDRNERRARTRRTRDEPKRRGPSAGSSRTVRQVRTEHKTPDPESQLPQIIIGFPKRLKLWRQGFGDLKSITQGCYSPTILPPNSLNYRESRIL
jgi:hypothetical protein